MGIKKNYFKYSRHNFGKDKVILLDFRGLNLLKYFIYFIILIEAYAIIYSNMQSLLKVNLHLLSLSTLLTELIILNLLNIYVFKNKVLEKPTRRFVELIFININIFTNLENFIYVHFNDINTYILLFIYFVLLFLIITLFLNLFKLNLIIAIKDSPVVKIIE